MRFESGAVLELAVEGRQKRANLLRERDVVQHLRDRVVVLVHQNDRQLTLAAHRLRRKRVDGACEIRARSPPDVVRTADFA